MAMKQGQSIDMQKLSILNHQFHVLSGPPANPVIGQGYFDSTLTQMQYWSGSAWVNMAANALLLGGNNSAYHLARANHTGTQTASTISDLATTVQSYPLNLFAAPTGNVAMGGYTLVNLSQTPNAAGQAAEYQWVLNQISSAVGDGVKGIKDPVRVLFAANVTTSGIPAATDGVTLAAGDRVLLTAQTTGSQNGIWLVQSGAWTRPRDFDQSSDITGGTEMLVNEGTTYGGSVWRITNTGTITLGTTALAFTQVNKLNTYTNGDGLSQNGTVFSVKPATGGAIVVNGAGVSVDFSIVSRKYSQNFGDGSATSFTIPHNLGTTDVIIQVKDPSGNVIQVEQATPSVNTVSLLFGYAPAVNHRVTIIG